MNFGHILNPACLRLIGAVMVGQAPVAGAAMPETATNVFECSAAPTAECPIDRLVFAELARLKIEPVLCSDAVFVRRAYLDVIGTLPSDRDPREAFADWLIAPRNPWFGRAAVNRVWAWLMGRGIVHEPDDIRDDNLPSNAALLARLENEFIAGRYDLKHLCRIILNSRTYQLSSMPRHTALEAASQFASYPLRRLEAEVLIDAINKITGSSDLYTSPIPEPFTYLPEGKPAIAIADGSITSPLAFSDVRRDGRRQAPRLDAQ